MRRFVEQWFFLILCCAAICQAEPKVDVEVLVEGVGPPIKQGERAVIAYQLELGNGTFIDRAGISQPYRFILGSPNIIRGLNLGVEGMKVGEKRRLTVPPDLGYGSRDQGVIPPNSTLYFEVELVRIESPDIEEPATADERDIKDKFQDENFLNQRHATKVNKPAMFEYLIRDFFTKPWRYEDGHLKIWRSTGRLCLVLLLTCVLALFGQKKGWWIL
jgi:FKBP-type peptidyl-prolyl isomerase-like protein